MAPSPNDPWRFAAWRDAESAYWGVWDSRRREWAWKPLAKRWAAEDLASAMNKGYAAGFADAMIEKAR